jgi:hypothetical protein
MRAAGIKYVELPGANFHPKTGKVIMQKINVPIFPSVSFFPETVLDSLDRVEWREHL